MPSLSLVEKIDEKKTIPDPDDQYLSMKQQAETILHTLRQGVPIRDLRRKNPNFPELIAQNEYENAMEIAYGLLTHHNETFNQIGDDLFHRLMDYHLAIGEYLPQRK